MSYIIPITVIDDFFENPVDVRNFALSQEFRPDPEHKWPGTRTKRISTLNYKLFDFVIKKVLKVFYSDDESYEYESSMYFQMSDKSYGSGWVHADVESLITGIVYLNINESLNAGTSICQPKSTGILPINLDSKIQFYKKEIDNCDKERYENNTQFDDSVIIKNKFNRLVLFDSHLYHKADEFIGDSTDTSRLTLIFFINKFLVHNYPIQRMRRFI